ncbi:MAG: hypothetical protein ACJ74H_15445 [Thermoanaerobaculia bacterium]
MIFVTSLACGLLFCRLQLLQIRGGILQYTIESRELTNESTRRRRDDPGSVRTVVVANDADEAIHQFVRERDAELVSFTDPGRGRESIATVKKEDVVFLVRVYAA